MEAEITATSEEFRKTMATAQDKFNQHDFAGARVACNRALSLCPNASEAECLKSRIEDVEKQKALQRAQAKELARSAGKWVGYLIGAGAVLVLIVIIAVSFWRWVTGTVCPWLLSSQGTLIGICVILSVLNGLIHAGRNTYAWIENGGGLFLAPLIITGVIVLVSVLLAVYAFEAPWRTGTGIGLVIGMLVSVICVLGSCSES